LTRFGIAKHAILEAGDRVKQCQRGNLATRQDEIAEADFQIDVSVEETLVDSLVSPTQQDAPLFPRKLLDERLIKVRLPA
jgi:hypothetical protein